MASEHTAKAFDSDLQELTRLVAEMGGLVERMIADSVDALIRREISARKERSTTACPSCGSTNPNTNKFCADCGAKLKR